MQEYLPLLAIAAYGLVLGVVGLFLARHEREARRSHEEQGVFAFEEGRHAVGSH